MAPGGSAAPRGTESATNSTAALARRMRTLALASDFPNKLDLPVMDLGDGNRVAPEKEGGAMTFALGVAVRGQGAVVCEVGGAVPAEVLADLFGRVEDAISSVFSGVSIP